MEQCSPLPTTVPLELNVGFALTRRIAKTYWVTLNDRERALYSDVSRFIRQHLNAPSDAKVKRWLSRMTLVTLQKELGSASQAATPTLERIALDERLPETERATLAQFADAARALTDNCEPTPHLGSTLSIWYARFGDASRLGGWALTSAHSAAPFAIAESISSAT